MISSESRIDMIKGRVSIIIPFYNEEEYIGECLDSVMNQTYHDIQLIMVNDGSTDDSVRIVSESGSVLKDRFSEVLYLQHENNQNQSAAMNTALPYCNGEFLMWLDADDLIALDNVMEKVAFLREYDDVMLVRTNGIISKEGSEGQFELAADKDKKTQDIFESLILDKTYCEPGCYMIRMEALKRQVPDLQIPVSSEGQNMQLLLPVSSVSECGYIDQCLFTYRIHGTNHSLRARGISAQLKRNREFESLYLEILKYCDCDTEKYSGMIRQKTIENEYSLLHQYAEKARSRKIQ